MSKQLTKNQMMKVLPIAMALQGGRKRRRRGAGFFGDLWSGIKSVGSAIASPVNDLLKATKVVSTLAPMIPVVGSTAGKLAGALGYGRRKRRVKRVSMRGGLASHLTTKRYVGGRRKKRSTRKRGGAYTQTMSY
jgi:hypothetical protein